MKDESEFGYRMCEEREIFFIKKIKQNWYFNEM